MRNESLERFVRNLEHFGKSQASYLLDGRSSDEVSADDILQSVGKVQFFSMDGGHWESVVENDIQLTATVLVDEEVMALDDYLRPEWPGVASGFHKWYQENN
jgi:hypothetical protein